MVDPQWLELLIECVAVNFVLVLLQFLWCFLFPMSREMGLDPGVFGRFDLAALVQPHFKFLFVCLLTNPVGVMLGCCTAHRAVQWSLLTTKPSCPAD